MIDIDGVAAVVFDCDGVLIDSQFANLAFYNKILQHFDVPSVTVDDKEKVTLCHTAASPQVFEQLIGLEHVAEAVVYSTQVDYDHFIPQLVLELGVVETLQRLQQKFPLAIATNRGISMDSILDYFDIADLFVSVVTHLDVAHPKPAPDMLLQVAKNLAVDVKDLIFVGDSKFDMLAAHAAGCQFISYKWDGGRRIDHHRQLAEILKV